MINPRNASTPGNYFSLVAPLFLLSSVFSSSLSAQESPFVGEWLLEISQGSTVQGTTNQRGILAIEMDGDELVGFLENGPIFLSVEDNNIAMTIDSRNASGTPLERYFDGAISGRQMSGKFGPPDNASEEELLVCERFPGGCIYPSGTWTAVPYVPVRPQSIEPNPVDISGAWRTASGSGMLKWTAALTAKGQQWHDTFNVDLDLPSLRCASPGVFWLQRSAPEIFIQDHKITFITSSGVVRQIYMDGRQPPEFLPYSAPGFSSGHWEGDHLIVETTLLNAGVRGYMGEMYSENSTMLERYWLNSDGTLSGEMALNDPENFTRSPLQRTLWARQDIDNVPVVGACDVDSFFRQIYKEELMQEYIDRSDRRF